MTPCKQCGVPNTTGLCPDCRAILRGVTEADIQRKADTDPHFRAIVRQMKRSEVL